MLQLRASNTASSLSIQFVCKVIKRKRTVRKHVSRSQRGHVIRFCVMSSLPHAVNITDTLVCSLIMPGFKRTRSRSSSVSSSNSAQRAKRAKSSEKRLLPGIKVYIVQAKLASPTIARLFRLAEAHTSKLCKTVEEADVVITAITMRKRLERHVPPNLFVGCSIDSKTHPPYSHILEVEVHFDSGMAAKLREARRTVAVHRICRPRN